MIDNPSQAVSLVPKRRLLPPTRRRFGSGSPFLLCIASSMLLVSFAPVSVCQSTDSSEAQTLLTRLAESYDKSLIGRDTVAFTLRTAVETTGDVVSDYPKHQQITWKYYKQGGKYGCYQTVQAVDAQGAAIQSRLNAFMQDVYSDDVRSFLDANGPLDFEGRPGLIMRLTHDTKLGSPAAEMIQQNGVAGALDGYVVGDLGRRVTDMVATATSVTVRTDNEVVDGVPTRVLDAKTPSGTYSLWLDPASGCLPRRIRVSRTGGDLLQGTP